MIVQTLTDAHLETVLDLKNAVNDLEDTKIATLDRSLQMRLIQDFRTLHYIVAKEQRSMLEEYESRTSLGAFVGRNSRVHINVQPSTHSLGGFYCASLDSVSRAASPDNVEEIPKVEDAEEYSTNWTEISEHTEGSSDSVEIILDTSGGMSGNESDTMAENVQSQTEEDFPMQRSFRMQTLSLVYACRSIKLRHQKSDSLSYLCVLPGLGS